MSDADAPWPAWTFDKRLDTPREVEVLVNDQLRRFHVQHHFDRVYFRRADEERIWATLEPCDASQSLPHLENALASGNYGWSYDSPRCYPAKVGKQNYGPALNLCFIIHPDGTGLVREWSSRDWISFAPSATRLLAFFPDLLFSERKGSIPIWRQPVLRSVRDQLLYRVVPPEEFEGLQARWLRGSEEEWKQVATWLWRAGLFQFDNPRSGGATLCCSCWPSVRYDLRTPHLEWIGAAQFREFLRQSFVFRGLDWLPNEEWRTRKHRRLFAKESRIRCRWRQERAVRGIGFSRYESPTFHEQLEARLELREWLRRKVPDSQIEEWLGAHT